MACIYEILVGTDDNYIGSTFNIGEIERMHKVNTNYPSHTNGTSKLYKKIRECDGNFIIHKLYDVDTDCELGLRIAEREAYDNLKPSLNSYRPYVSEAEFKKEKKIYNHNYSQSHKEERNEKRRNKYHEDPVEREKVIESNKNYRINNPEKVKERKQREYQKNKKRYSESNKIWRENNKEKKKADDKAYYERTKEQQKIKNKERYEMNKEKINEKVVCECGVECAKKGLKRHMNSKKHLKFIAEQNKTN